MTTAADDPAVEGAFEAYLAGRPVPDEAAELAVFAEAVRATATEPGRPSAALAELLATGLLTDLSSPSARTARSAGAPPSRRDARIRNRRRFAMLFPALLAKILSAGAIAQAATGAGIVVVAVTGAGVAGVLPDPLQNTVATVVETVTPMTLTNEDDETAEDETPTEPITAEPIEESTDESTDETTDETTDPETGTVEDPAPALTLEDWEKGPDAEQSFGSWVSEGARHGYVDGATVSKWAHERNAQRRGERAPEPELPQEPTEDAEVDVVEDTVDPEPRTDDRGNRGDGTKNNGNGNGNGKGNGRN
jgi:hypothetical protein